MQIVGSTLNAVLQSSERDLLDVFEFYTSGVTNLTAANAAKLFSSVAVTWNGESYEQQTISRGDVSRYMSERFNSVTVTLSNIDRTIAIWLAGTTLEGYRLVIRTISRRSDTESLVLFVGRCEKPFEVDNTTVQITAKQDLGTIEARLPWRIFSKTCQVADGFKGLECLAGESLGSKSAAYQAAPACDFSFGQCTQYANTKAFQGFRFNTKNGIFKYRIRRTGPDIRQRKQWTSQEDSPYGNPIPLGFGRTQILLTPIQHADTAEYVAGQSVVGEGEILALDNVRCVQEGFETGFQFINKTHLGKFGTDSSQAPTGFFASAGDRYSHTAYIEYTVKGNNTDTGEPAPNIAAVVMWQKIPVWNGSDWTTEEWSDNPVAILRKLLTDNRSLNYSATWIDDTVAAATFDYCNEPLIDDSNGDTLYLTDEIQSIEGTEFRNYNSTGILNTDYFLYKLGVSSDPSQIRDVTYNYFDPASPPASISTVTRYRKRYTCNFHLTESTRAIDFIYKSLLPAFRGYLTTGSDGKLQIRTERPQLTQYLRGNKEAGSDTLPIEDAAAWKALSFDPLYVLVGVGLSTAEVLEVSSVDYSDGNSVTLAASDTGTTTATASGSNLSGGDATTQASGTVTIGGTPAGGDTITATIDGVDCTYTLTASDTTGSAAAMLAVVINSTVAINRYITATWDSGTPAVVTISAKLGTLNLSSALVNGHALLEEVMHVHAAFTGVAAGPFTRGNILRDTFQRPLGNRQSSFNQFIINYTDAVSDFQETELRENDYTHQSTINKVNKLTIDGRCVDNYHQASRLVQAARYKYREGDFFCAWKSTGTALLLEEGDVVAVQHPAMPNKPWVPLRLEEVRSSQDWRVSLVGRLYSSSQFPETARPTTVSLVTAVAWPVTAPPTPTGLNLTQPTPGTVRGTFSFGNYPGQQIAKVEVQKPGTGSYVDTGVRIDPDASLGGAFEVAGLPSGSNSFRVTSSNDRGNVSSALTGSITVTNPLSPRIEPGAIALSVTVYAPTVT